MSTTGCGPLTIKAPIIGLSYTSVPREPTLGQGHHLPMLGSPSWEESSTWGWGPPQHRQPLCQRNCLLWLVRCFSPFCWRSSTLKRDILLQKGSLAGRPSCGFSTQFLLHSANSQEARSECILGTLGRPLAHCKRLPLQASCSQRHWLVWSSAQRGSEVGGRAGGGGRAGTSPRVTKPPPLRSPQPATARHPRDPVTRRGLRAPRPTWCRCRRRAARQPSHRPRPRPSVAPRSTAGTSSAGTGRRVSRPSRSRASLPQAGKLRAMTATRTPAP